MLGLDLAQLVENGNASVVSLIPMGCHDGKKVQKCIQYCKSVW